MGPGWAGGLDASSGLMVVSFFPGKHSSRIKYQVFFIYRILACYQEQIKPYWNIMYNMLRSPDFPVVFHQLCYGPLSQAICFPRCDFKLKEKVRNSASNHTNMQIEKSSLYIH